MNEKLQAANRKTVEHDRIVICPIYGCEMKKKLKPLKFGLFGFSKHPRCSQHQRSLVYADELVEEFFSACTSCLFDRSALPPSSLLEQLKLKDSEYVPQFIDAWIYCSSTGRNGRVISNYVDGLSRGYISLLSRKEKKAVDRGDPEKRHQMLVSGIQKITSDYTKFLNYLGEKTDELLPSPELVPYPPMIKHAIKHWIDVQLLGLKTSKPTSILAEKKELFDGVLSIGTGLNLLGKSNDMLNKMISPYELFSGYREFSRAGLTRELIHRNIINLKVKHDSTGKNDEKRSKGFNIATNTNNHPEFYNRSEKNIEKEGNNKTELLLKIFNVAQERDVSLRMFNSIAQKEDVNNVEKAAFKAASLLLLKLIKKYNLPRFVKNKKHLQQMLNGKFYLIKGEPGFKKLANQENVKYGGVVYLIKSTKPLEISINVLKQFYIGVTGKTLKNRFVEHTEDAINSYIINFEWPSRLIEHLILKAMDDYLRSSLKDDSGISPLQNFIENQILGKEKWEKKREIANIASILYSQYFCMEVIEVHRNYETAWARERWNIINYPLNINGKSYQGTLYPNCLNMVLPPSKPGHRTLPLYDIIFLISLGYNGPEINEMIYNYYQIKIDFRIIYHRLKRFWKDWAEILGLFFKPVMQSLLMHTNYDWQDIAKALHRSPTYRIKKNFKMWFYGLNVTQLRSIIKNKNFKWENLDEYAKKINLNLLDENLIKGVSVDIWKEWFIKDIGMEKIANKLGYKNEHSFRSSWIKQDRISIFQKKFGESYTMAVRKYRKQRTIEILIDEDFIYLTLLGSRLYWIYINEFGFKNWKDYIDAKPSQGLRNCQDFFNRLFKDERVHANVLEKINSSNYKKNSEIHNITKKILNS